MKRIYLSPPNVGNQENALVAEAIESGWAAPVGPNLNLFEKKLESFMNGRRVLAVNSGTSALHLALILAEVRKGDEVIVGTFTFAACANVVLYQGAIPVFMDSEMETWNLDPEVLNEYLETCSKKPKAVILTHLYGVPAKVGEIKTICERHNLTLIEDAAEAVGSTFKGQQLGSFGDFGIFSFNGNKLITTGGGGALITGEKGYERGHHLATQANSDGVGYEHDEIGYNYRLSNILAAVGLAQLEKMEEFVTRKREIFESYRTQLPSLFILTKESKDCFCNRWLTTPIVEAAEIDVLDIVRFLDDRNIQARPLWKPLHLHKAYTEFSFVGTGVAESIYGNGLCLPSGTTLTDQDQDYIIEQIKTFLS